MRDFRSKKKIHLGRGALSLLAGGIGLTAGVTLAASSSSVLYLNGQVASTEMLNVKGKAYVGVSDIARALDMKVIKRGDGSLEIAKAGGANQVGGLQGKVGDTLFDGKWRMTVSSVGVSSRHTMATQGEPYDTTGAMNYDINDHSVTPRNGNELIIVNCRIANGQKTAQPLWIYYQDSNTALADDAGESYAPVGYDVDGAPTQTKPLLPGAKVEIPVIFSVPVGKHITSFVFNLRNSDGGKGSNARVLLDVH